MALAGSDQPSTTANLVALEQGLYALEIGASPCMLGRVSSLQVPAVHVSALRNEREQGAEIIGTSGHGDSWLDREGGTVIVKSPAGGAHVLVTRLWSSGAGRLGTRYPGAAARSAPFE